MALGCLATLSGSKVNTAAAQFDEKEHIERFQEECFDGEEIASQNLVLVVAHELPPIGGAASIWRGRDAVTAQDVGYGLGRDLMTQLATFPLDLAMAPVVVFAGQAYDELFKLFFCTRATTPIFPGIGPFATDQCTMPLEDGFGLEDTNDGLELPDRTTGD